MKQAQKVGGFMIPRMKILFDHDIFMTIYCSNNFLRFA